MRYNIQYYSMIHCTIDIYGAVQYRLRDLQAPLFRVLSLTTRRL